MKKYLDACAAPGGKSFQLLARNEKVTLNDKAQVEYKFLKKIYID